MERRYQWCRVKMSGQVQKDWRGKQNENSAGVLGEAKKKPLILNGRKDADRGSRLRDIFSSLQSLFVCTGTLSRHATPACGTF